MTATPAGCNFLVVPYGDCKIGCNIRRQVGRTRNSVAIHVDPDGRVLIDAPLRATDAEIRRAVTRRARWVQSRLQEIDNSRRHVLPREYVSGETVYYLGRRYRLRVLPSKEMPAVCLRGCYLQVAVGSRSPGDVRIALHTWYRARARRILHLRLEELCRRLPWMKQIPPTSLRKMKSRWGSCSPKGLLTLNPDLVRAPRDCVDYVILHELCHLKVHDHSPRFHRLLETHLPGWKVMKSRLDGMAEMILAT